MLLSQALQLFVQQRAADGASTHTLGQYARHIGALDRWLAHTHQPRDIVAIDHATLARFLNSDRVRHRADGRPKKATTVNSLRSCLRAFFAYVHAAGYVTQNPARLIRRARCAAAPPRTLPAQDCERLLQALANRDDPRSRRDHVLMSLLLKVGLRIGSAVGLDIRDLDLDEGVAWLRAAKGDRDEKAFLPPGIVALLREHVGRRRRGPVFESTPGKRLTVRQARRRLQQAAEAAGIDRRVSPHVLRHSFATQALARTGNVRLVQKLLHHASLQSTAVYADVADDDLRAALAG